MSMSPLPSTHCKASTLYKHLATVFVWLSYQNKFQYVNIETTYEYVFWILWKKKKWNLIC